MLHAGGEPHCHNHDDCDLNRMEGRWAQVMQRPDGFWCLASPDCSSKAMMVCVAIFDHLCLVRGRERVCINADEGSC